EDGIRKAGGRELGEPSEEKSENEHGQQRLEDNPSNADDGLLVADFDVAPDKEIEEFAITPELGEAELESSAGRLDAEDGLRCGQRESDGRRWSSDGSHQERASDSGRKIDPEVGYQRKREKESVWRGGLLELLDVAFLDLAHEVAAAEKVEAETGKDG